MLRIFTLVFVLGLAACESIAVPSTPPTAQTWLCGKEYVNHAWGYQRRGVVFDTSGTVWRYDIRSSPQNLVNPWSPVDVTRLSDADLKKRYEGASTSNKKIPAAEIAQHFPLIAKAADATPSTPTSVGADMGQHLTYCYTYDEQTHFYSQVMLDNRGDWTSTNPSPAARTLSGWIDAVTAPFE